MTTTASSAFVRLSDVTKRYGANTAVDGLSLDIPHANLVTLLGPSGCGKTTTLRMIAGLETATSGSIHISDKDVTNTSATYRSVAMVFQSYALFPHMTVFENVGYGLKVSGAKRSEIQRKASEGLERVGLAGFGDRLPSELSGGQQQRVAVARAIVLEPDVLLFDEPLSNLDAKLRRHVREEIRSLQKELDLTAVYVTHDQDEAMAVSDRIVVMNQGRIAQQGSPTELYDRPNSAFIADFIGNANVLPCTVLDSVDQLATVQIGNALVKAHNTHSLQGRAHLAVRPQHIQLQHGGGDRHVTGRVLSSAFLGNHVEYDVDTELGRVYIVDHQMEDRFDAGEAVALNLRDNTTAVVPINP